MKLIRLIIVFIVYSNNLTAQQSSEELLSQNVFREDFSLDFQSMIEVGASRIGTSSGIYIVA